ncbi:hypothetical protein AZF37_01085 [endosymbiont 'TC1' of Trimyema compressum]|uniref:UDP-galactopyranose mutase n=1 Tax=endosymbiont 'TC1' of Trimyema compressum TaxID=243899 RepID=UPI0007F08EE0|nr:UDP-galactopyranose mutase [endosymbiont 'TC1' of Trimyema compressum]AMP19963.1 hypothetical protein AZF37_01085 [endosymbiont 'TC1' of Trimyema compressum]
MKVLTVVVPVYNMEEYLGRCLDSMLDDSIKDDLEIICVNDGSKDNSINIMEKYSREYPETVRFIDKENGGHGSTVNAGIEAAKGEFFRVVDSDDWLNKINFIQLVKNLKDLVKKDVDLIISAYSREEAYKGYQTIIHYNFPNQEIVNFIYGNYLLDNSTKADQEKYYTMAASTYRTQILKDSPHRLSEKSPYVDMEYNLFFIKHVKNVYYFDAPIYCYFIGRKDQSVAKSSLLRNFSFHENVLKRVISYYNENTYDNAAYKKYIRKTIVYMLNTHYMIQAFFREGKKQKEGNALARVFDAYLKETSKDLYDALNHRAYIAKGRKHNFSTSSFNILQYGLCRRKEIKAKTWEKPLDRQDKVYDVIVGGAGYAGSIMARKYAELGKKVLLVDRRKHIGGNMYDYKNDSGILIHKYGPHIAYMETDKAYDFLSQFTEWNQYEHRVNVEIQGKEVPLPFNLTGIDIMFDSEKATKLKDILIAQYGMYSKVPILDMLNSDNKDLNELAQFVYDNIFVDYTTKMWGLDPKEISPAVTGRVPVRISYDNRHFTNRIQVMPKHGYTRIFEIMLNHENIDILLGEDVKKVVVLDKNNKTLYYNNQVFNGTYVYTGALDEFLNYEFGELSYRSLEFKIENHNVDKIQETGTLNWPDKRPETRRSEMKTLTSQQDIKGTTVTLTEYPGPCNKYAEHWNEPYYPIPSNENESNYKLYYDELSKIKNLVLVGRLAEYKYYNMEAIILKALELFERVGK